MKIAYLSDSLLSSGKANAIHVIKMSQALALEGHSVALYIRAKSSSSDLKSIVSNHIRGKNDQICNCYSYNFIDFIHFKIKIVKNRKY